MKKQFYYLLIVFLPLCFSNTSSAQLVGGQAFLQGAYLEIGMCTNDAFGCTTSPAGYHPHTFGTELAEVYDYGHDGWTIGAPPYMGDYTYPGSPFEGWEIQVAGTRSQQYASPAYSFTPYNYSGAITMSATSFTGYSNVGGVISADWAGTVTAGGAVLSLKQRTEVDTFGSAVNVTCRIYNTSATNATGVYYWRSCDPDNDETWPGGGFPTDNVVNAQNDADHRVAVTGSGYSSTHPPLTLCTKDCRAVACVYNSWGLTVTQDLAAVWSQTYAPASYAVGVHDPGDIGLGLVFNIGTINAGDSAVISYSYVFNGWTGIDSVGAHPEPSVRIAGGPIVGPPLPYPNVVIDTYNACLNPGLTLVPVDLLYADDAAWTWSKWTWSPSTGLSATTGTHVLVTTTVLPPTLTYTVTGTDPATCQTRTMYITFLTCNNVRANSPCFGDTLFLRRVGDSTGATYSWTGPGGFTSTQQDPIIYPATYVDSGKFYVIRTVGGLSDTDSISVTVHYKPVITATSNAPLCAGMIDTLQLNVGPGMAGMTYSWTGPPAFTSTLQAPTVPGYTSADTGIYRVIATSPYGCSDTAIVDAGMIPQPNPPIITDQNYCQGMPFIPFTVTGILSGATVYWYPGPTGGVPTTTAPTIPTSIVGLYYVWATQKVGSCESMRGEDSVRVITTPPAPIVTGTTQYCQYIGPFVPVTVIPTAPGDSFLWYTVATGGSATFPEPVPNIGIVPSGGVYHYWVSLKDSGCEGPRTPVNITIHPKPAPPIVTPQSYCQYWVPANLAVRPDGTDPPETFQFYGPGVVSPGTSINPYPPTSVAPDTFTYYITETTTYGCVSDSATDKVIIKYKPDVPVTKNDRYCQHDQNARPLNYLVDSAWNADSLSWYKATVPVPRTPIPSTTGAPGYTTWYVSQWVNGCQSDSGAVTIQLVYKPVFSIWASSPWVCQFDSLKLAYVPLGTSLFEPAYYWTLPQGSLPVAQTNIGDSMLTVQFDSSNQNFFVVKLRASDDSGFCFSDTSIQIKVIPQPTMSSFTKPNVCLNDTVQLALSTRSADANTYAWYIDNDTLNASPAINLISANSNSGGPFLIRWIDTGEHVIMVTSKTLEGCLSKPMYDSVNVRAIPDATFQILTAAGASLCIDDSVQFSANMANYSYSYEWSPAQYFNNENKPNIWGRMRDAKNIVSLKVTSPWGCYATQSMEVDPGSCCTLLFPNAFAPNVTGTGTEADRVFQPISTGNHTYHMFRIVNRWGQTVFQSASSTDAKWDGTMNGVPQDMGTYYYFIKYDCGGQTFEQKGDVTLIR